jgi:hypothetical protein
MEKKFKDWLNEAFYGNYCGPGPALNADCSGLKDNSPLPNPINKVDAICQSHDLSYCQCKSGWTHGLLGKKGSACSQAADEEMRQKLAALIPTLQGTEKLAANLMLRYFQSHAKIQGITNRNKMQTISSKDTYPSF